jgi:hypothetical protein
MNITRPLTIVAMLRLGSTALAQQPDELKQWVLGQPQGLSPDDYAFTRTIRSESTSNGKTENKVNVEKFDPTKPAEARWTLVSVGSPATASTDSRGRMVFHFAALPKDTVKVMDSDVSQNATADASVTEANGVPFVEQLPVSVRPMRLKLIGKLNSYEYTARYRIGPDVKPLLMEQTSDMSGSGMGQTRGAHMVVTYSDYRAIGGLHK